MTKDVKLKAELRKKDDKNLKDKNLIPGVMYGPDIKESISIKIRKIELEKAYKQAGESALIDLEIEGESPAKIIIKDIQKDSVKNDILHVDFYKVDMKKKITTEIPLEFIGESVAVKTLGGILVTSLDSVDVECLPGDLVQKIEVDLSVLATLDDLIRVKDLKIPEGIEVVNDLDSMVVGVSEAREEKEEVIPDAEKTSDGEASVDNKAETSETESK